MRDEKSSAILSRRDEANEEQIRVLFITNPLGLGSQEERKVGLLTIYCRDGVKLLDIMFDRVRLRVGHLAELVLPSRKATKPHPVHIRLRQKVLEHPGFQLPSLW